MQQNFTPGPYEQRGPHIMSAAGKVGQAIGDPLDRVTLANAALFAAAPDMFRALNSLAANLRALGFADDEEVSGADTVDAVAEAFEEIEAALEKAGGRAS